MADFGSLSPTYDELLRSAQLAMLSPQPVSFGALSGAEPVDTGAFEAAALRQRRAVRPEAGRQEGAATKVLDKYAPHVIENAISLPQRAYEASETRRMGGDYDPGPAVETALGVMGSTGFGAPARIVGAGPVKRPTIPGKALPKMPDEAVVQVDPRKIDAAWQRDSGVYVGPGGSGGSPEKYARAREFLTTADQFEAPSLRMNEGGTPVFDDGRHRFAVMRDAGMDRVPVAIDPYSTELAKRFGLLGLAGMGAPAAFGSLAGSVELNQ